MADETKSAEDRENTPAGRPVVEAMQARQELASARATGNDERVKAALKVLAAAGVREQTREAAAESRRKAADDGDGEETGREQPPRARRAPSKHTG